MQGKSRQGLPCPGTGPGDAVARLDSTSSVHSRHPPAGVESTDGLSMQFQASDTLQSRSYVGLILAQFLAAFNDQAIHIVAIFYAGDMLVRYVALPHLDDKAVIAVVTACFISPFFFFSPLAGMLADRYSKRTTVVLWKLAEVGMMGLAL